MGYWKHAQSYYVKNGEPTSEVDAIRTVLRDVRRLYGRTPIAEFRPKCLRAEAIVTAAPGATDWSDQLPVGIRTH